MLLAKIALGFGGTLLLAGAYTFHEGALRVAVDEHRVNGSHIHLFLPAAVMPLATRLAPGDKIEHALREAGPWLPTLRALTTELRSYPDADFVEVKDGEEHVQVRTREGALLIDVETPEKTVHVSCPLVAIEDFSAELEARRPGA